MVISRSTCQKEEKLCIQVKYLIYTVCRDFQFVVIYAFSPAKCAFPKFWRLQNMAFSRSVQNLQYCRLYTVLYYKPLSCSSKPAVLQDCSSPHTPSNTGCAEFHRKLDIADQILNTAHWTLDTGHWTLDTGHGTLDTGHWILDTDF